MGSLPAWSSAGARGLEATTEAPLLRDLAGWTDPAWTDQQPPQHVHHERYDDKDDEYLYCSQAIHNYVRGSFFALSFTYVEYF